MTPIFLITGTPGAGKSSVATALMRRFSHGLHIPMDDLREWVVAGLAAPVPVWTDETTRQFGLSRQAALAVTNVYAGAGFAVAIDDVIGAAEADTLIGQYLAGHTVYRVLLRPSLEATLGRNQQRTHKPFDHTFLVDTIHHLYDLLEPTPYAAGGWLVLDSTRLSLDGTVDAILTYFRLPGP